MTWNKVTSSALFKILIIVVALACLCLLPVLLGLGPGIALSLCISTLGWIVYLLFGMAKVLSYESSLESPLGISVKTREKELRQEYHMLKRALKELELDYGMGKLAEVDYQWMRNQYRSRAVLILKKMDQEPDVKKQIQADVEARRNPLSSQQTMEIET